MHATQPGNLDQGGMPVAGRLMRFSFITRIALLTHATWTAIFSLFAEDTMLARMIAAGGTPAVYIQMLMLAVVAVGWIDILINDVLPRQFTFDWARERRHQGYLILGVSYMTHAFASAGSPINDAGLLAARYATLGMVCGWYSWVATFRPDHAT